MMLSRFRAVSAICLAVLIVCTLAFIFGNSLMPAEKSNSVSYGVGEAVEPVLRPTLDAVEGASVSDELYSFFVRKLAHFSEFALLGALLTLLVFTLRRSLACELMLMPPFVALLCAVADEYIQSFTSRSSMVQDVIIDFAGALAGIFFACIAVLIVRSISKKRRRA